MRGSNSLASLLEGAQHDIRRRGLFPAPLVERESVDPVHHEIGPAVFGDAAVEQPRDAGMIEPRQGLAFEREQSGQVVALGADQLDRDAHLEGAVGALGAIDLAHAAGAHRLAQSPRTQSGSRLERRCRFAHTGIQSILDQRPGRPIEQAARFGARGQQALQPATQAGCAAIQIIDPGRAIVVRQVEQVVEQAVEQPAARRRQSRGVRSITLAGHASALDLHQ